MKVTVVTNPQAPHQVELCGLMAEGLQRHGVTVERLLPGQAAAADAVVCWGWRNALMHRDNRLDVLVLERGHVGDRRYWTSAGWNGLGRRGRYVSAQDGERWQRHHGALVRPWRRQEGYALLLGQVAGDSAVQGLDFSAWAHDTAHALIMAGWTVRYRPHPLSRDYGPEGTALSTGTLEDDLAGAELVVAYNSTAAVAAVLSGVPTVTLDEGAMAWDVAGHSLDEIVTPDRAEWCAGLAWTQFSRAEIESGAAWDHLKEIM